MKGTAELLATDVPGFEAGVCQLLMDPKTSHTVFYHSHPKASRHTINGSLRDVPRNGDRKWKYRGQLGIRSSRQLDVRRSDRDRPQPDAESPAISSSAHPGSPITFAPRCGTAKPGVRNGRAPSISVDTRTGLLSPVAVCWCSMASASPSVGRTTSITANPLLCSSDLELDTEPPGAADDAIHVHRSDSLADATP